MSQQKIYTKRKITIIKCKNRRETLSILLKLARGYWRCIFEYKQRCTKTQNNILCRADFNFGNVMSIVIQPGGLSESRREYLYRETVCETTVPGCYSPAIVEIYELMSSQI